MRFQRYLKYQTKWDDTAHIKLDSQYAARLAPFGRLRSSELGAELS
jgi:hypothetical protein